MPDKELPDIATHSLIQNADTSEPKENELEEKVRRQIDEMRGSPAGTPGGRPRKKVNCVIYARTSTKEQSSGLETQIQVCKDAIAVADRLQKQVRTIIEVITDPNVSGDTMPNARPNFPRLLQLAQANSIHEVWCQTRDRLSRNVDILGHIRVLLSHENHVLIRCLDDSDDKPLSRIKDVFGEMELDKYREKRKLGQERALSAGLSMYKPPFGYKTTGGLDHRFIVDEEKREMIVGILKALDAGDIPVVRIAKHFSVTEGIVRRIRDNPIYRTGEVMYRGKVAYKVESIYPQESEATE